MNALWNFVVAHQTSFTLGGYYVAANFLSALPAPTVRSSATYTFFFKFANGLGANIIRARSTHVEDSPNFQDAVNKLPPKGA